jgi:hypothetical protein
VSSFSDRKPVTKASQAPFENGLGALRQFIRPRKRNVEICELCSAEVASQHPHLLEPGTRKLLCTCDACAILFSGMGTKYKRVPRRALALPDFNLTDAQWESLMIPIGMAFFFRSTPDDRMVAFYPSPAGATDSLLPLEMWKEIEDANPILHTMEADVEALLVNRIGHVRGFADPEYFILPIDQCYKLVGLIRTYWRGLSGGAELWQEIAQFFTTLKQHAVVIRNAVRKEAPKEVRKEVREETNA